MPLSELITGTTMVYERLSADLLTALKTKLTIELKRSSYYNLSKDQAKGKSAATNRITLTQRDSLSLSLCYWARKLRFWNS